MLNKKNLARKLAKRTSLNVEEADQVLRELLDVIVEELLDGEQEISLVGFGKFYLYEHKQRPVRNPKTQEEMILKNYKSLRFKQSNVIKKLLKDSSHEDSSN